MKLLIYKHQIKKFKRSASSAYPRKVYGIMLGRRNDGNTYTIIQIIVPPAVEATYEYVIPDYKEIDAIVSGNKLQYIGQIHSHPQAAPTVSPHDHKYWDVKKDEIIGIMSIRKRNIYKTTELKFWLKNSALPVRFKIIKKKSR